MAARSDLCRRHLAGTSVAFRRSTEMISCPLATTWYGRHIGPPTAFAVCQHAQTHALLWPNKKSGNQQPLRRMQEWLPLTWLTCQFWLTGTCDPPKKQVGDPSGPPACWYRTAVEWSCWLLANFSALALLAGVALGEWLVVHENCEMVDTSM